MPGIGHTLETSLSSRVVFQWSVRILAMLMSPLYVEEAFEPAVLTHGLHHLRLRWPFKYRMLTSGFI